MGALGCSALDPFIMKRAINMKVAEKRTSEHTAQVAAVPQLRQCGMVAWQETEGPMRLSSLATWLASAMFCWEMARMFFSSCAMAKGMQEEPSLVTNVPCGQAARAPAGQPQHISNCQSDSHAHDGPRDSCSWAH